MTGTPHRNSVPHTLACLFMAGLVLAACARFRDDPRYVAGDLLKRAADTVARFRRIPELEQVDRHIAGARAVVILPSVTKAGFVIGAEGGNGVLLARDPSATWGYPAFYFLGAASVGFQAGIQNTEIILVVRNDQALDAILRHQGKLGVDAGLSIVFVGLGMEASTTTSLGADVLAFANANVGIFAGASLEGAALVRRRDLNEAFYSPGATPRSIVIDGRHQNPEADRLRAVLAGR